MRHRLSTVRGLRARISALLFAGLFCVGAAAAQERLAVTTDLSGIEDDALRSVLTKNLSSEQETPGYQAYGPLRRAVEADAGLIRRRLISRGYFAATVESALQRTEGGASVTYSVTAGPLFQVSDHKIVYTDIIEAERPSSLQEVGLTTDNLEQSSALSEVEAKLIAHLRNNGFPAAAAVRRHVTARYEEGTATAIFTITSGEQVQYGDVRLLGAEVTDPNYVRALRPFEDTDYVSREQLDTYRNALAATNLFATIDVSPAEPDEGQSDILVTVEEKKRRTVGAGISYDTDVGAGVTAYWENRNLFGRGERLTVEVGYAVPLQEVGVIFTKPVPRLPGGWRATGLLQNEDTDAFTARSIEVGLGIYQLLLNDKLELSADGQLIYADILDDTEAAGDDSSEDEFLSFSFPLSARFNNENNPLNPTSGHRLRLAITPFLGTTSFSRIELGGATRRQFGAEGRTTLAARGLLGGSLGQDAADLPATERFFAGGGGSVRGFGFQLAGPLEEGDPVGGASIAEVNLEVRRQIGRGLQLAAFADAGSVYATETPDFSGDFLTGAGLGVRYFTPIGPVRVDVATPLNPRTAEDDGFEDDVVQIYIAIGQPF